MKRFRPYRQDGRLRPRGSVLFLFGFGLLSMVVALMPHPNGFTGRFGKYIPLDQVVVYRWFFGLLAIAIWAIAGLAVRDRRR